MFPRMRATLQAALAQAHADAQAAHAAQAQADDAIQRAQGTIAPAKTDLEAAQATYAAAQAAYNQAAAAVQERQQDLDDATAALDDADIDRPDGKPGTPIAILLRLRKAVTAAQAALTSAKTEAANAQAALGPAADRVSLDQAKVADGQAALQAAQAASATAKQRSTTATQQAATLQAQLDELDAQEHAVTAEPLDEVAVARAADEQTAMLHQARSDRFDRRTHAAQLAADRAARLAGQDGTIDSLASVSASLRAAPGFALYPQLGSVAAAVDAVVAASRAQRGSEPGSRTDDVAGAAATLRNALVQLQQAQSSANAAAATTQAEQDKWSSRVADLGTEWQ